MDKSLILDCLLDTMLLLKEQAIEARRDSDIDKEDEFKKGISFGYYEVMHLFEQQTKSFGISLNDINIKDISPDKDLLGIDEIIRP